MNAVLAKPIPHVLAYWRSDLISLKYCCGAFSAFTVVIARPSVAIDPT
jgi:hypothetical protein